MGKDIEVKFRDYEVYKLSICGPGQAGKTSLCKRLVHNKFTRTYKETVGAEFFSYRFNTKKGKNVGLFYDFAGQQRFVSVRNVLYSGTDAAAVVFDVTKKDSFRSVAQYIRELRKKLKDVEITIVGNKIDSKKREISFEDAKRIAEKLGCKYIETSAETGEGLGEFFKTLIHSAISYKKKKVSVAE